jgi:hypothetical protein
MIYLGRFTAGASVFYGANFHSDQGTLVDPAAPAARLRDAAGSWSDLAAPAKQDGKTGFFGGTIDTTGFAAGQYIVRMSGTVATAKDVATVFSVEVGPAPTVLTGDAYARLGAAGAGLTALGDARLANLDAAVSTRSTYAGGAVASVTAAVELTAEYDAAKTAAQAGDAMTLTAGERQAILATAPAAESYAAAGEIPTLAEFLFMLWAAVAQFEVVSTTVSAKKLDGETEAMQFNLDSATAPTSRVRNA